MCASAVQHLEEEMESVAIWTQKTVFENDSRWVIFFSCREEMHREWLANESIHKDWMDGLQRMQSGGRGTSKSDEYDKLKVFFH